MHDNPKSATSSGAQTRNRTHSSMQCFHVIGRDHLFGCFCYVGGPSNLIIERTLWSMCNFAPGFPRYTCMIWQWTKNMANEHWNRVSWTHNSIAIQMKKKPKQFQGMCVWAVATTLAAFFFTLYTWLHSVCVPNTTWPLNNVPLGPNSPRAKPSRPGSQIMGNETMSCQESNTA